MSSSSSLSVHSCGYGEEILANQTLGAYSVVIGNMAEDRVNLAGSEVSMLWSKHNVVLSRLQGRGSGKDIHPNVQTSCPSTQLIANLCCTCRCSRKEKASTNKSLFHGSSPCSSRRDNESRFSTSNKFSETQAIMETRVLLHDQKFYITVIIVLEYALFTTNNFCLKYYFALHFIS